MNRHQIRKRQTASMQWMWVNWMKSDRVYTPPDPDVESGIIDWEKFELLTNWYRAGTTDIVRSRKFIDQPIVNSRIEREEIGLEEMVEWEDLRWSRNDVPDIVTFWEQGGDERKAEWLDGDSLVKYDQRKLKKQGRTLLSDGKQKVGVMNDRDFRERCTTVGGTLQAVYMRSCEDDLRIVHDPEWLAEQIGCDLTDAFTYAEVFRRFGIDRNTVYKLINGYYDNRTSEWKSGLGKIGVARGAKYAEILETLCIETDAITDAEDIQLTREYYLRVSQDMVDSGDWCLQYGTHNPYWNDQMAFIEESITIVDDPDSLIVAEPVDDEFEGFISPFGDEEIEIPQILTATWRLFDGSETLPHEIICEIKEADVEDIGIIIRRMFPQGRYRAEWGYNDNYSKSGFMTLSQTRQAWWYIKDRQQVLATECRQYITADSRKVLHEIRTMRKPQARAYLATYCAGNAFNSYGREITWKHRPCAHEKYAIWAEFRKL